MTPAIAVLSAWILFGGSHLLLSTPLIRTPLSRSLGTTRFVVLYTLIATLTLSLLIAAIAHYGGDGHLGLALSSETPMRWILGAAALSGAMLAVAGIANYPGSPIAVLARRYRAQDAVKQKSLPTPGAVERVTRHPFFVGLALLMAAHALLASTLASAVYFAGFAILALIGIPMQDRKLRERHGDLYGDYLSNSSVMPFAAIRRSSNDDKAPVWPTLVTATAGTVLLAALHPLWRIGHGAPFAALILIGGLYAVVKQLWHSRKK